ncbi:MAG: protein-glutamate O-methyltransferase family protein [Chloroflexi bacterium]|nr:protein-glutamate O-methyltransferase family protein [Chloroflexota bacterium]
MTRPHLPPPRIDLATLPPLISTNDPHSFAKFTLEGRDTRILQEMEHASYFSPDLKRAFKKLRTEILDGVIQPLREDAPDADFWRQVSKPYSGRSWLDAPWFWAETFFYRRILEIVGYFQLGAWHERDPFAPLKDAELRPDVAPKRVRGLLQSLTPGNLTPNPSPIGRGEFETFELLLYAALWGNRVDLSYNVERMVGRAERLHDERANLLVDDAARVWGFLQTHRVKQLVYVADNAGTELAYDLALIEYLLHARLAEKIVVHLKPQPFYVSDAMPQDVERTLAAFDTANAETRALAASLRALRAQQRLELRVHWFYPTPLHFFEMPDDLWNTMRSCDFVILKGDVNYRRVVGDAHWKHTIAFEYPTRYFPAPFVALRTLKSDVIVGLTAAQVDALNHADREWRVNGKRGVAQAKISD